MHRSTPAPTQIIDLRSDFLSRPSAAMRAAAEMARDSHCFGLREDPWQQRLERRVADLVGMEDALVFPTCSMANTTALMLWAPPGSQVLTQPHAHVLVSEAGAGAALAGAMLCAVGDAAVPADAAMPAIDSWDKALRAASDPQQAAVRLCVLENSHNRAGGTALPVAYSAAVTAMAKQRGIATHLDGARLFNAAHALGVAPSALAKGFDTVSVSLNKTFGAPIAAALAGSESTIQRALTIRQRLGGGIRPTGPASAAALAALDDMSHLARVQALAGRLRAGLAECRALEVHSPETPTNIVMATLRSTHAADWLVGRMAAGGLRALSLDGSRIRFVVYRDIDASQIERAIEIVHEAVMPERA